MQVVILCGGLGTRLREETGFRPKPMVEVGGRPILWHIMKTYAYYGFNEFVLCLGYKGELIREFFLHYEALNSDVTVKLGSKSEFIYHSKHTEDGWSITLADTGENSMTGSRIKKIEKYIKGDDFMLTYGDGLADIDIKALLDFHKKHNKIGTVTGVNFHSHFGALGNKGDSVTEFNEKPLSDGRISGGFFVFKKKFFDYLSAEDSCVLEQKPLEALTKKGELKMYTHDGAWQCMDTYRDHQLLQSMWQKGNAFWKVWKDE